MKNTVTAVIEFYFKGKKFSPSMTVELDSVLQNHGHIPDLCPLIANANGIDLYSYEYEIMQSEAITFIQASGLVANFVNDGMLDIEAFETAWAENQLHLKLQRIAKQYLGVDDLQQNPELQNALLDAYRLDR